MHYHSSNTIQIKKVYAWLPAPDTYTIIICINTEVNLSNSIKSSTESKTEIKSEMCQEMTEYQEVISVGPNKSTNLLKALWFLIGAPFTTDILEVKLYLGQRLNVNWPAEIITVWRKLAEHYTSSEDRSMWKITGDFGRTHLYCTMMPSLIPWWTQ